jgi:hypothetical protein
MQWTCTAHDGELVGADGAGDVCFLEGPAGRCKSRRQCHSRVRKEHREMEARLGELADHGNPIFAEVASELPIPEKMLAVGTESAGVPEEAKVAGVVPAEA